MSWISTVPARDRSELRRWREAVGPVRVAGVGEGGVPEGGVPEGGVPEGGDPEGGDSGARGARTRPERRHFTVASWNTRVGGGAIHAFWDRLAGRGGIAGSGPVVLLLQEVFAGGPRFPDAGAGSVWATRIADRPPGEDRTDIVSFARKTGLHLVYVPSMRNGGPDDGGPPEDRGNAIVANVPLSSPCAIELPFERQRRVAVVATVTIGTASVALCSVHLDNRAPWRYVWRSLGLARRRQMTGLLTVFPKRAAEDTPGRVDAHVLGGDFNTWFRGRAEGCYKAARRRLPHPEHPDSAPTHHLELGGWLRQSDHLLFRLPPGWRGGYRRVGDAFGSDHYPLVGTVEPCAAQYPPRA